MKYTFIFSLCLFFYSSIFAQEVDISAQLKDIENGNLEKARTEMLELKEKHPDDPSVMFLESVLIENAKDAMPRFSLIVGSYPKSKYADAALFRMYSYYYAMGIYSSADNYARQMQKDYPDSPYLKYIEDKDDTAGDGSNASSAANEQINSGKDDEYVFTIQAGAFLKLENALSLKKSFEAKGYYSAVSLKEIAGSTLNIVTVGRYRTEQEAKSDMEKIGREFSIEARIARIGNPD